MVFDKIMKNDGKFNPSAANKCMVREIRYENPGPTIIVLEYNPKLKSKITNSLTERIASFFTKNTTK